MALNILTPISLWKDFDDTLPLNEEVISESSSEGITVREVYFYGRQTEKGRVRIYAQYIFPSDLKEFPAVMILFEANTPFDYKFVAHYLNNGYGVLCVDYCGDNGTEKCTKYPEDVDYANFVRAGTHIDFAEPTARETSWYEWVAATRYAVKYLSSREEVTAFGAIGLRTGGEILFKVAASTHFACMISVCAAGWLAYQHIDKYSDEGQQLTDERRRFIAGIDSQSYAPYVKCPVLLLSAVNDKKYDHVRVYDTFRMLNPSVEKAILFSAHGNGLIGSHSVKNIDLFLDKYLKGRSVFISKPVSVTTEEDAEGNLVARGTFDASGEAIECGVFYTENVAGAKVRDWTRILTKPVRGENSFTIPLNLYAQSEKALIYAFVKYSNNLSVTSNVKEVALTKRYKNSMVKSRVIYNAATDGFNGFAGFRRRSKSVADCFTEANSSDVRLEHGYGGILGITASAGLISYRVGEPRYSSPEGSSFRFDAYAAEDAVLNVMFYLDAEEERGFGADVKVAGGGLWKSIFLNPTDFKAPTGNFLRDFSEVVSVVFYSEDKEVLVNNVLWI